MLKVSNEVSHVVGILRGLLTFLQTKIKHDIQRTFFLSQISYCHLIWGNNSFKDQQATPIAEKSSARHTEPLFTKHGILKVGFLHNNILLEIYYAGQKKRSYRAAI